MTELATWLFATSQLTPHGLCLIWRPDLIWALVFADGLIAAAYFSIPICLAQLTRKRDDISFSWVLALFGAFILLCGTTHLMDVVTLWVPAYGLMVTLKIMTALVSVATAFVLWTLMPRILGFPSLRNLRDLNAKLEREIDERARAEAALRDVMLGLEGRVVERTRSLALASADLQAEIDRRRRHEERARRVVEAAPNALMMVREDGLIELVNAQAERIFGYPAGELVGKSVEILLPARFRAQHAHHRADFLANPRPSEMGFGREDAAVMDLTASIIAAFTTVETVLLERMSEVREVA